MTAVASIESNITGLRTCEEVTIGHIDGTAANQVWVEQEPNSYSDLGGNIETVARNPINPGRQRKKGTVVDEESTAGWNTDLTQANMQALLRGFTRSNYRSKKEFTGVAVSVTTSDDSYNATGIHTGSYAGDLVFASGYAGALNNGLKLVSSVATDEIVMSTNLTDETSATTAKLVTVGFQFASGDATITNSGSAFPVLGATAKDCTQLGLIPGEWIFIGGDAAGVKFAGSAYNNGWCRVRSVAAGGVTLDKTPGTMVTDNGAGKTIQIFKGRQLKNELGSLIVRRTYTVERIMGFSDTADQTKEQAQYVYGWCPNELTINASAASKLTLDVKGPGLTSGTINENVTGANTLLSKVAGVVRQAVTEADPFNTSSDITRIRLALVSATNAAPTPLFTYSEDATVTINNNVSGNKALGVLGSFDTNAGMFEVGGSLTAYFSDVAAIESVRNNADVTLDMIFVKQNAGVTVDIPLIGLGNALANVEQDQPIKIPLDSMAYTGAKIASTLNHTIMFGFFDYLPNAADVAA